MRTREWIVSVIKGIFRVFVKDEVSEIMESINGEGLFDWKDWIAGDIGGFS